MEFCIDLLVIAIEQINVAALPSMQIATQSFAPKPNFSSKLISARL
jgi:hypothetical protein